MKFALKIAAIITALVVLLDVAISSALSYYDSHTKSAWLQLAARELSPGASEHEMAAFMRRHTFRHVRDEYRHDYGGFVPQSQIDRFLFDRKVQIVLEMTGANTFDRAEVQVYYTFL